MARAHIFEDGGGRELAYVKMSRARERSTLYAVADSIEQAVEDLRWCWAQSRRIGWAIDKGTPAPGLEPEPSSPPLAPTVSASLRHARLVAEREALAAVIPADPGFAYHHAQQRVRELSAQLEDLDRAEGWGVWKATPVGDAAIAWKQAHRTWESSLARAEHVGWREGHGLRRQARVAAERVWPLRDRFDALAAPERARLAQELPEAKEVLADLEGRYRGSLHFGIAHPEAVRRLHRLDHQIATAAWELDVERQDLDGIVAVPPQLHPQPRGIERGAQTLDRGLDRALDIGLGL